MLKNVHIDRVLLVLVLYNFATESLTTLRLTKQKLTRMTDEACLFHDLLSRSNLYHCVWSVITSDNFTPAKRDQSFSAMFTVNEP